MKYNLFSLEILYICNVLKIGLIGVSNLFICCISMRFFNLVVRVRGVL